MIMVMIQYGPQLHHHFNMIKYIIKLLYQLIDLLESFQESDGSIPHDSKTYTQAIEIYESEVYEYDPYCDINITAIQESLEFDECPNLYEVIDAHRRFCNISIQLDEL